MKFPRNARIFRGHLDAAPFASVFFLLVIFMMLGSLVYTPGVRLRLPVAENLPGPGQPPLKVALDKNGRLYFDDQLIGENALKSRLREAARKSDEPPVLVVQADASVSYETLLHLTLLAREAGIYEAWLAALPGVFTPPPRPAYP